MRQRLRLRHDQVTRRDERLLVGGGHDLARRQRRQDRAQADHAAAGHDDEIDVITGGHLGHRVRRVE